jgi:hypothetical protein
MPAICHGDCTPSADSKIFSVTISHPVVIPPQGKLSQGLGPQNPPVTHSKFNRASLSKYWRISGRPTAQGLVDKMRSVTKMMGENSVDNSAEVITFSQSGNHAE